MQKNLFLGLLLLAAFPAAGRAGVTEERLARAVRSDDHAAIKSLLAHADPNAPLADKSGVLSWAVDRQDAESVRLLLAAGARPAPLTQGGVSPLALACELGNPDIVLGLLKAGGDAKAVRADGITVFALCAGSSTPQALAAMLAKGANVNAADPLGQTPLMRAAIRGRTDDIDFLIRHGAHVNAVEKKGFTPLFFAIRSNVPAASQALMDAGADVNAILGDGTSVIQAAVMVNNIPAAMQAVSRGADLKRADKEGKQAIHVAAQTGDADFVKMVLSKGGDPNAMTVLPPAPAPIQVAAVAPPVAGAAGAGAAAPPPRRPPPLQPMPVPGTPLQFAARAGSVAAMKVLVEAGAKPAIKGPDGMSLAMAAANGGKLEAMQYAYELDPHLDVIARGGRSIMHLAVANAKAPEPEAVIQFLVDKGAKMDVADDRGSTAGDDLNRGGAQNIRVFYIQLLRDHGIVSVAH